MRTSDRQCSVRGFTLPELIVGVAVSAIMSVAIVSMITAWLQNYSVSTVRNTMTTDMQKAMEGIQRDIRKSNKFLAITQAVDSNAPSPPGSWQASSTILILGQTPRDLTGTGLYSTSNYQGFLDSIVYYVRNGTLYRRVVPATNYPTNVNLPLQTCAPPQAGGGCPSDRPVIRDVGSVAFTYKNRAGLPTTDPLLATAVFVDIQTQKTQAGQPVAVKLTGSGALRTNTTLLTSTLAPFALGPGGLNAAFSININPTVPQQDVYIRGRLTLNTSSIVGSAVLPFGNLYVANMGCGTGSSYMSSCAPQQPISTGFGGSVNAGNICATGQSTTTGLTTLNPGCVAPVLDLPPFDKAAFAAKMTSTAGAVSCGSFFGCNVTLPANTKYTGNIGGGSGPLNLTIGGDIYVNAKFGNDASGGSSTLGTTIKPADGLTKPPIVVVNEEIGMLNVAINKNNLGIAPIFISFYSSDITCSKNDSCTTRTPQFIYNSLNNSNHAITLDSFLITTYNASFYAYFDSISASYTAINGNIAAQQLIIGGAFTNINLTGDPWPSS